MLVSVARISVSLPIVVDVDSRCVRSPHMVPGIQVPENCCTKAEVTALELQKQPVFDPCKSFKGLLQLNSSCRIPSELKRHQLKMHRNLVYMKYTLVAVYLTLK